MKNKNLKIGIIDYKINNITSIKMFLKVKISFSNC